jgi:tRNA dimethylallyltransferase
MQKSQPIFIVGPTAAGKTAVALQLARLINAEIVSADSMQVYRGMDIGTAKPTPDERRQIPHHLIDVCDVNEDFDAKKFVALAQKAVADIQNRGKIALIVGGTGLYMRALRRGLFEGAPKNPEIRAKWEQKTASELFAELKKVDPLTASRIDRHNKRRLVRALEVYFSTGKPLASLQTQWKNDAKDAPIFCLNRDRADLHARIERRIDEQIAAGWLNEVKNLLKRGLEQNATAMQAAGYRELVAHLRGKISLEEAIARTKTRTRQLAKRQLTWFRREPNLIWMQLAHDETPQQTANRVKEMMAQR